MSYTELLWVWSGFAGAPAYTKFRFEGALTGAQAGTAGSNVKTFLTSCSSYIPNTVVLAAPANAQIFDDDGTLQSEVALSPSVSNTTGGAAGTYAAPAGMCVHWLTGSVHLGHKVRGRTFLVPLASSAFDTDGTFASTPLGNIRAAATAYAASSPKPVIVSRKPFGGGVASLVAQITAAQVNDRAAILKSRRA